MLARLAERADVELVLPVATAGGSAVPAALAGHDNVLLVDARGLEAFVAALAASRLVLADAPAAREAAAAVGVPALATDRADAGAVLREAERLLDDADALLAA
jgi:UDP-N-acetylglucosamine 2-epimerase